jgi:NAD(P)-dependent dehydrogenase (short-subunit alcohol dehydrogenase family)
MNRRVVVVTGASSGIGLVTAKHLHALGYIVYGLSRTLPKENVPFAYVTADLASVEAVETAVATIAQSEKSLYALVNCAGMGISGAAEYATDAEVKKIFDVNVFGLHRLTRALIPLLRNADNARIVNVSSVAAELVIPFQTFYSMTKAAINAYTEGLRMELRPFGIRVCAVMPGDTKTGFTGAREKSAVETNSLYNERIRRSVERMERDEQKGKDPMTVAKAIARMLKQKKPPLYATVGIEYKLIVFLKRLLPNNLRNFILYQMYGK